MVTDDLVEALAEHLHEDWRAAKMEAGVTSRPDPEGREQMLPWAQLDDAVKASNRRQASTALVALSAMGYRVVKGD